MPTNVTIARDYSEEVQAQTGQADISVMLLSLIACLANLALIALSPTYAAAVAALGQY